MAIFQLYVSHSQKVNPINILLNHIKPPLNPINPPFSYDFPMVFLWSSPGPDPQPGPRRLLRGQRLHLAALCGLARQQRALAGAPGGGSRRRDPSRGAERGFQMGFFCWDWDGFNGNIECDIEWNLIMEPYHLMSVRLMVRN